MSEKLSERVAESFPTFICGTGQCLTTLTQFVRPGRELAGNLLEDVTDWHNSVEAIERSGVEVPAAVRFALSSLHDAACRWTDRMDREQAKEALKP